ncbi:MAG: transposase zinc-binding domain-containing protein [Ardenticatenia bacterium]|nr:transposase zinc-binding domain-containing protein [Ardenticatenia bacterium]
MRVRCEGCRAEYLLALSCKTRFFCPSCHAKRLACWTQWLGEELLAPVPHRQMVFVLPKRLRPYFQWRRKLLGDLARIAARTATDFVRATLNEPELSVGMALCIQTHGSILNWQPHIHALVTDGGFRPDGSFVRLPAHATDALTEAFRRHVLRLSSRASCSSRRWRQPRARRATQGSPGTRG